jgi:DNA-binding transcriptional regulator LsrR (DeoR family)
MNIPETRGFQYDFQVAAAALLFARHYGLQDLQERIAQMLGVTQGHVSKLLSRARKDGLLKVCASFEDHLLTEEQREEVSRRTSSKTIELKEFLQSCTSKNQKTTFAEVIVVECASDSEAARLHRFGTMAAHQVIQLLPKARLIGVAWGRTLRAVVDAMREQVINTARAKFDADFIPICGEPIAQHPHGKSASVIAIELREILSKNLSLRAEDESATLLGLPAIIPIKGENAKTMQWHIRRLAGYRSIFIGSNNEHSRKPPLIQEVDCIITSVGHKTWNLNDFWDPAMAPDSSDLEQYFYGNIAGIFIEKESLPARLRKKADELKEAWTGARLEHFHKCAAKAVKADKVGVIALCVGKEKADILLEGIRRGLINTAIIDSELRDALLDLKQKT